MVPLLVSAAFFLAVYFRDLRGDFRDRTHQFEDLDACKSPPRQSRQAEGVGGTAPRRHQVRNFIERNLVWWLALPASISLVLSAVLSLPYLHTFLFVCGLILILACRRIIAVGLAIAALTMMVSLGGLNWLVIGTDQHRWQPRLTLIVIPFEALGDDPSERYMANILNKGLTRELASWNGLDFIPVKTASMAQRETVELDRRRAQPRPSYTLQGRVLRSNETISIQTRLSDAQTARDVWSAQLTADPGNRSRMLDELTSAIASALDGELAR